MARSILNQFRSIRLYDAIPLIASLGIYYLLGYQINRENFPLLITALALLFIFSFYLYFSYIRKNIPFNVLLFAGLCYRLIFLVSEPRLSDDYKRYLWDGTLLNHYINPYEYKPSEIAPSVTEGLGEWQKLALEKDYYSLYPPLPQLAFAIAAHAPRNSLRLLLMHLIALILEIGSIFLIIRLIHILHLPIERALLYILNPLPVIELSGNLHIEGFMIFFTLFAAYYFYKNKIITSGLGLSASILSKFIPVIFLPAFLKWPPQRKQFYFLLSVAFPLILFILLIGPKSLVHIRESTALYFNTFEFNGGLYSIIRWIGFEIKGYNVIREIAPFLTLSTALWLLGISFFQWIRPFRSIFSFFTHSLAGYFLLATTVNPWYITPILAFGLFTRSYYPVAWSFLVFLSYQAFSSGSYQVSSVILFIEYGLLFLIIILDYIRNKNESYSKTSDTLSSEY